MHTNTSVSAVAVPEKSMARRVYAVTDLADAYEIRLPEGTDSDPETLARFVFASQPGWVSKLMRVRDAVAGRFGLKTSYGLKQNAGGRIGIFKIYEMTDVEILLGEDDRHLNFRVSVLHRWKQLSSENAPFLVVSTVVQCHNRLGCIYIALIKPFHKLVVRAALRKAARSRWPTHEPRAVSPASVTPA
jgi:hypothetical protein